jgi:hypothetical protein
MPQKIHDQSPEVAAMSQHWPIAAALMGGTATMRAAGLTYLPRESRESLEDWQYRLQTSTLLPAFKRTAQVMTGKPFSKPFTFTEDVPVKIQDGFQDCDMQGNNLHSFASEVMNDALVFGISGVLVDFPKTEGQARTLADERNMGARPYLVHIKHQQILGWKAKRFNGAMVLTQLRIAETEEVEDGDFGVATVERVRVLQPGMYQVYQKVKDEFTLVEQGTTTLQVIPFVMFYGRKQAFMCGISPLLDLAYLNVKHWQHQSDQDDSARFARKRLLAFIGMEEGDTVVAGSHYAINIPMGGDVKVIQGSSESVATGRAELQSLEEHMVMTGAELLQPRAQTLKTATQSMSEDEANKCELQRITEQFEDGLDQIIALQCKWLNIPEAGNVSMFKGFAANTLSEASAQLVLTMQQGGLITKQTAVKEQQRRGILSADIDVDTELDSVEAEGPALGMMNEDDLVQVQPTATLEAIAQPILDLTPLIEAIRALQPAAPVQPQPTVINMTMPEQQAPVLNFTAAPVTVEGSTVNVTPPVVNVAAPEITVESPTVNVAAPVVNVEAAKAPEVTVPVNVTVGKAGNVKFTEDADGNISGAVIE